MKLSLIAFLSAITSRVAAETKLTLLHGRFIYFVVLSHSFGPMDQHLDSHDFRFRFIHTETVNDHHSHLTERSAGYVNVFGEDIPPSVSANNGNTTYVRAYFGGFPRLVTAFQDLENDAAERGRDVLRLHAGDAITGTTFYTLFKGDADAKLMTHLCFDVFAPGNHEVRNVDS